MVECTMCLGKAKLAVLIVAFTAWIQVGVHGQDALPSLGTINQNFDTLGSSTNLPSYWRAVKGLPNSWARARNSVDFSADSGEPQAEGSYNWGDSGSTNRALGFLASSELREVSLLLRMRNDTSTTIMRSFAINYLVKQFYRGGSSGSVHLEYSTNGSTWSLVSSTSLSASNFLAPTDYLFDEPNTLFVPLEEFSVPEVLPGGDIYFRWRFSVDSGSGAGYGIDDVWITGSRSLAASDFTYQETSEGIAIAGYTGNATNVSIPPSINGQDVVRITSGAFAGKPGITLVEIPDTVAFIDNQAFASCGQLTNVTLGGGVTSIGNSAFQGTQITSISIPASVTNIGEYAFSSTSLTTATISSGSIGDFAFWYLPLTNVTLGSGVTSIGNYAFYESYLTNISIPASVTNIGEYAFVHTSLTNATILSGVIGDFAFWDTPLANVTLGSGVTSIGNAALQATSLTNIVIPTSVTNIGAGAFWNTPLTSITVPASVANIGEGAFGGNTNLTSMLWKGNAPADTNWLADLNPNAAIFYMPDALGWTPLYGGRATQVFLPKAELPSFAPSTGFQFSWTGVGAIPMNVQRSTSLTGPWTVISPYNSDGEYTDSSPPAGRAFYRAVLP
jgi:hypothetical protein